MFIHTFHLRLKPGTEEAQIAAAQDGIRALGSQISELRSTEVGRNVSPRANGFELGGVMRFDDAAAFARYNTHPAHMALLQMLGPILAEAVELDFDPKA